MRLRLGTPERGDISRYGWEGDWRSVIPAVTVAGFRRSWKGLEGMFCQKGVFCDEHRGGGPQYMDLIQNRQTSIHLYFKSILSHTAGVLCIQPEGMDVSLYHRIPGRGQTAPCTPGGLVRRLSGRRLLPEERRSGTSRGSTLPDPLPGLSLASRSSKQPFCGRKATDSCSCPSQKGHFHVNVPHFPRQHITAAFF